MIISIQGFLWGVCGYLFIQNINLINGLLVSIIVLGLIVGFMTVSYASKRVANAYSISTILGFSIFVYLTIGSSGQSILFVSFLFLIFLIKSANISYKNYLKTIQLSLELESKLDLEKQLQSQKEKLVSQSQMASIGEMASGVAHEINNPLTVINGSIFSIIKSLKKSNSVDEKVFERCDEIVKTTRRVSEIISALQDFSTNTTNNDAEEVSVKSLITNVVNLFKEKLDSNNIKLEINHFNNDFNINCNKNEVSQVLFNLLINSIYFVSKLDTKWIRFETSIEDKSFVIKVIDSGDGINQDIQEKILEPFFSTKDIGEGSGLGLSSSIGVLRKNNAQLSIDHKTQNTTFIIKFNKPV
jgi:C4-dicarboxylate-specific signal transduction histidine kinase